jgi:hypothetical protein
VHEQPFGNIVVPKSGAPRPYRTGEHWAASTIRRVGASTAGRVRLEVALSVPIGQVLATGIWFTDVATQSQATHIEHGLFAVIALVGD